MSDKQIVVEYLNGQTRHYPTDKGWSKDINGCCLVIGRGLPRTHIPLTVIAAYHVEDLPSLVNAAEQPDAAVRRLAVEHNDANTLVDEAWGIIAAAMGVHTFKDYPKSLETEVIDPVPGWNDAARRWRDRYHTYLSRVPLAEYDEAALAQAVHDNAHEPVVAEDADTGRPAKWLDVAVSTDPYAIPANRIGEPAEANA